MQETYLQHYGILGQKWGIRRYQNEDGSLTPAGRERYGVGERENASRVALTSNARQLKETRQQYYDLKKQRKALRKQKRANVWVDAGEVFSKAAQSEGSNPNDLIKDFKKSARNMTLLSALEVGSGLVLANAGKSEAASVLTALGTTSLATASVFGTGALMSKKALNAYEKSKK